MPRHVLSPAPSLPAPDFMTVPMSLPQLLPPPPLRVRSHFLPPPVGQRPRAAATGCSSRRSCVAAFPTLERDGLLFTWMDNSPEGLKAKVGHAACALAGGEG